MLCRYVTDALPAIVVSTLLFVCPCEKPDWICFRGLKVKNYYSHVIAYITGYTDKSKLWLGLV